MHRYKVTLTGHRDGKVHITDIRARILNTEKAPLGTLLVTVPQGGGPSDWVHINLDSHDKNALEMKDGSLTGRRFTHVANRWAREGEPLVFMVSGGTSKLLTYEWEILVDTTYDGEAETVPVRLPGGKPFRTIGWDFSAPYESYLEMNLATGYFERAAQPEAPLP